MKYQSELKNTDLKELRKLLWRWRQGHSDPVRAVVSCGKLLDAVQVELDVKDQEIEELQAQLHKRIAKATTKKKTNGRKKAKRKGVRITEGEKPKPNGEASPPPAA